MLDVAFTLICVILANLVLAASLYAFWMFASEVFGGWREIIGRRHRLRFTLRELFAVVTIAGVTFGLLRLVSVEGWAAQSLMLILSLLWSLALVLGTQTIYADIFRRARRQLQSGAAPEPPLDFSTLTRKPCEPEAASASEDAVSHV